MCATVATVSQRAAALLMFMMPGSSCRFNAWNPAIRASSTVNSRLVDFGSALGVGVEGKAFARVVDAKSNRTVEIRVSWQTPFSN